MNRFQSLLLFSLVLIVGKLSRAEEDRLVRARIEFETGVENFKTEEPERALESFHKAYQLDPNWRIFFNIAQCYAVLKRYGDAIIAFEKYLSEGGDELSAERKGMVFEQLNELRQMVGTVLFAGPNDVEFYVDGVLRGKTPNASGVAVAAGVRHEFRFVKDEVTIGTRTETVRGGQTITIEIPSPMTKGLDEPARSATLTIVPNSEISTKSHAETSTKIFPSALFWTGVGVSVVLAGGAGILDLVAYRKMNQNEKNDTVRSLQVTGIVLLCTAGVAVIGTTIIAFFTDFSSHARDDKLALSVWSSETGGGLQLEGRF